jgi:hypothetical protein
MPVKSQQSNPRTLPAISSSEGWVEVTVVNGLRCRANRCARNKSFDAR